MTDEIDTSFPERIWAVFEQHESKRGHPVVFASAKKTKGQEYVHADLYDAERQRAERAEAEKLHLRDVVCESMSQLRWLNEKEQRGSTNTVLARLEHALSQNEGGDEWAIR